MSEVLNYDISIVATLRHIEDSMLKYSLQNYGSAGAIFLAYYADKISPTGLLAVVVLAGIYTLAICLNIKRYRVLGKVHRIVQKQWLASQPALCNALCGDTDCKSVVLVQKYPFSMYVPVIIISLLPAIPGVWIFVTL